MNGVKNQYFQILADNLPFLVARFDRHGKNIYVNSFIEKVTRNPVEHFIGKSAAEAGLPDRLVQQWLQKLAIILQEKSIQTSLFVYDLPKGKRYFDTKFIPEKDASGEVETIVVFSIEITEQVLMEKSLRESEEKYYSIFQSSKDGICLTIPDGSILEANDAVCRMVGHSREELLRGGRQLIFDDNDPRMISALEERARNGYARAELTCIRADGSRFPVLLSSSLFVANNGEPRAVIVLTDISDVKRAESEQDRLREQISRFLESTSDGFMSVDAEWRYQFVSDYALQMLNRQRGELIGKVIWDVFPELVNGPFYTLCHRVVEEKIPNSNEVFNADAKKWFESRVLPAPDGITIFFQDITGRKNVEESLRNNEERIRLAIEAADIWVFNQDTDLRYTWSHNARMKSWGTEPIGKTDADFLNADDAGKLMDIKRTVITSGSRIHDEIAIHNEEGLRIYEFFYEPLKNSGGNIIGIIGAMLDVTTRKQIEIDLINSREQLHLLASHLQEVREEERIKLSRELHDDLGQSMTGLKMDLAWMMKRLSSDDEDFKKVIIEKISSMSGQIDSMIKSVRRIATDLRPNVLDYFGLVAAIEWEADEFGKRSGIPCIFKTNAAKIELEPMQATAIYRILQEALTNVVRHAKAEIVQVTLEKEEALLKLTIRDNGIGIQAENISAIHSIGILGMRERSLLLGGNFQITGKPGEGTEITLTIPIKGEHHV
jgi:PAS domain S-box-containing protein